MQRARYASCFLSSVQGVEMELRALNIESSIPHFIKKKLSIHNEEIIEAWHITQCIVLSERTLGIRVHARYFNGIICITKNDDEHYTVDFNKNERFTELPQYAVLQYSVSGLFQDQLLEFIDYAVDKIPDHKDTPLGVQFRFVNPRRFVPFIESYQEEYFFNR